MSQSTEMVNKSLDSAQNKQASEESKSLEEIKEIFEALEKDHLDRTSPGTQANYLIQKSPLGGQVLALFLEQKYKKKFKFNLTPCLSSYNAPLGNCKEQDFEMLCGAIGQSSCIGTLEFNLHLLSAFDLNSLFSRGGEYNTQPWDALFSEHQDKARQFAKALAKNKSIKKLILQGSYGQNTQYERFVNSRLLQQTLSILLQEGIKVNQSILCLQLDNFYMTNDDNDSICKILADFFRSTPNLMINMLYITGKRGSNFVARHSGDFTPKGVALLMEALEENPSIKRLPAPDSLHIAGNSLLAGNSRESLNQYYKDLSRFIREKKELRELGHTFSRNVTVGQEDEQPNQENLQILANALGANRSLKKLGLYQFAKDEHRILFSSLSSEHNALKALTYQCGDISLIEQDISLIRKVLLQNKIGRFTFKIQDDLSKKQELLTQLYLEIVHDNPYLKYLELSRNDLYHFYPDQKFVVELAKNTQLRSLSLSGIPLHGDELNWILRQNKIIEAISIYNTSSYSLFDILEALADNGVVQRCIISCGNWNSSYSLERINKYLKRNQQFKLEASKLYKNGVNECLATSGNFHPVLQQLTWSYLKRTDIQWKSLVPKLLEQYKLLEQHKAKTKADKISI